MADIKTFYLPDLGEGLPDATVVEWHVKEGDTIKLDAPLVSMETAKAVVDVPSPYSGTVKKLHGAAGDIIETGAALADFEIDPNARQRAEAESTGHHHGPKKGVGSQAPDDASKVIASDDGGEIDLDAHRAARVGLHVREAQRLAVFVERPAALHVLAFRAADGDQRVERLRADDRLREREDQRELAFVLFGISRRERETLRLFGLRRRRFGGDRLLSLDLGHPVGRAVAGCGDEQRADERKGTGVPQAGHGRTRIHVNSPGGVARAVYRRLHGGLRAEDGPIQRPEGVFGGTGSQGDAATQA